MIHKICYVVRICFVSLIGHVALCVVMSMCFLKCFVAPTPQTRICHISLFFGVSLRPQITSNPGGVFLTRG